MKKIIDELLKIIKTNYVKKDSLPSVEEIERIIQEFIPHKSFKYIPDLSRSIHKRMMEGK